MLKQAPDWSGLRALQAATIGGHLLVPDKLLDAGADVNVAPSTSHAGLTALQVAPGSCRLDTVRRLLFVGTNVDTTNSRGLTALLTAVRYAALHPRRSS
jgi:ankyrin repeat protein